MLSLAGETTAQVGSHFLYAERACGFGASGAFAGLPQRDNWSVWSADSGFLLTFGAHHGQVELTGYGGKRRLEGEVTLMSSYPPPPPPGAPPPPPGPGGPGGVGHRLEEAIELIEMELRHAIGYVNDAVIPQVRAESISAMRKVSDTLKNLADRMEQKGPRSG